MENHEEQTVEIVPTSTSPIVEYRSTDAALAILRQRHEGARYEVATTAGLKAAREARAELRTYRVELEKTRVRIKAPALEHTRLIDAEAKRITAAIEALEQPIDAQIKAEEQRKEAERAERERRERERLAAIAAEIESLRRFPLEYVGASAADIAEAIAELRTTSVDTIEPPHRDDAQSALAASIAKLEEMHAATERSEAEAARLRAEREQLEQQRAAQEAELAEQRRLAAEAQAEVDRLAKAERDRLDAEARAAAEVEREREAKERAERERVESERRRAAEAQAAAERAEIERVQAEQRAEADRLANERAEIERARRAEEIASVTLVDAARGAHELLVASGLGERIESVKLAAAIERAAAEAPAATTARGVRRRRGVDL